MSLHFRRLLACSLALSALAASACDDAAPARLSRVGAEPPGAHCASGGLATAEGDDDDGDGVLDDDEVDTLTYACHPGDAPVLTRQEPEGASGACPAGGTAVHVGHDLEGGGQLDESEIEETSRVCAAEAIHRGDLTITAGVDDARYQDLRVVVGALTVKGGGTAALPALEVVTGDLTVADQHQALAMPALRAVGGTLTIGSVETLGLPALTQVGGLTIEPTTRLATIELPALARVDHDLGLADNGTLAMLRLPALAAIGGELSLRSLPALTGVQLDAVVGIGGSITVQKCDALPALALPALAGVGANVLLSGDALRDVDLRALPGAGVVRITDKKLEHVDLRALTSVDELWVVSQHGAPGSGTLASVDLSALEVVDGDVILAGFGTATALALPELRTVERLRLQDLGAITTLSVPALDHADLLWLQEASHLATVHVGDLSTSLGGLALIAVDFPADAVVTLPPEVKGAVVVRASGDTDLRSLASLRHVDRLVVTDCDELVSLAGLDPALTLGALELTANDGLTSLAGLEHIDHLTGDLHIFGSDLLTDLAPLANVKVIGGSLHIHGMASLHDLHGLGVVAIGGDLDISANDQLVTLAGLEPLASVGGQVTIEFNDVPAAEIAALKARLGK